MTWESFVKGIEKYTEFEKGVSSAENSEKIRKVPNQA